MKLCETLRVTSTIAMRRLLSFAPRKFRSRIKEKINACDMIQAANGQRLGAFRWPVLLAVLEQYSMNTIRNYIKFEKMRRLEKSSFVCGGDREGSRTSQCYHGN